MKKSSVTKKDHGEHNSCMVSEYVLKDGDIEVNILNLGASILRIITPDSDGNTQDIVLGYDSWTDYIANNDYLGCLAGRFANRIGNASFELNGNKILLSANEENRCLHGGKSGLNKKVFQCESIDDSDGASVTLSCESLDGEEGFPGHLKVSVTYKLSAGELSISYEAVSDADTVINLTNHSYFNLAGHNSGSILEHEMKIEADHYLPITEEYLPIEVTAVGGTPFDLRVMKPVANGLRSTFDQIKLCGGYDHCYVLADRNRELSLAAVVQHPFTGRTMECWTTEPGIQLYTANHMDGINGKGGAYYGKFPAFCLETQHYPDSPNRPDFPTTTLRAGESFNSTTVYKFGTL